MNWITLYLQECGTHKPLVSARVVAQAWNTLVELQAHNVAMDALANGPSPEGLMQRLDGAGIPVPAHLLSIFPVRPAP